MGMFHANYYTFGVPSVARSNVRLLPVFGEYGVGTSEKLGGEIYRVDQNILDICKLNNITRKLILSVVLQ